MTQDEAQDNSKEELNAEETAEKLRDLTFLYSTKKTINKVIAPLPQFRPIHPTPKKNVKENNSNPLKHTPLALVKRRTSREYFNALTSYQK